MRDRLQRSTLKTGLRLLFKSPSRLPLPPHWLRQGLEQLAALMAPPVPENAIRSLALAGVNTEQHVQSSQHAVLFLHGGAFFAGSPKTHRGFAHALAQRLGANVFVPDYRLAPENPYPAAHEDALNAWRGLLALGYRAEDIVVAGDSAGGGLALSLALTLRDLGQPVPMTLLLLSPFVDLTLTSDAMQSLAGRDPMLSRQLLRRAVEWYRYDLASDDPRLSPLLADLHDLPPILIQVGSEEILLDDALSLETRARAAGVCIECQIWPGLWHDFQLLGEQLPEAALALDAMSRFVDATRLGENPCLR